MHNLTNSLRWGAAVGILLTALILDYLNFGMYAISWIVTTAYAVWIRYKCKQPPFKSILFALGTLLFSSFVLFLVGNIWYSATDSYNGAYAFNVGVGIQLYRSLTGTWCMLLLVIAIFLYQLAQKILSSDS